MVAFVLDDAGVEPLDLALDYLAVEAGSAIPDAQVTRHDAAQPGNRQAALPSERPLPSDGLDHRVDQHGQILRDVARHVAETVAQYLKYHDPVRLMHLWRGNAGAAGILHRLDHVVDEAAQNGMPHPGDLQQSHDINM